MFPRALLLLTLLALPAAAQRVPETLALEDVVSLAVRNSPSALSAEQDISIARQRLREARFMSLPQFTLSGTASKVKLEYPVILGAELGDRFLDPAISDRFYTLRVQALQPIYTGGLNTNTVKLAKAAQNQARVSYEAVRSQAALNAKKAFYTLMYQDRLAEVSAAALDRATALAGLVHKNAYEELEASVLLSALSDSARQAVKDEESAATDLLRVLGREPGPRPRLAGAFETRPVPADPGGSLVTAMEDRSELKSELYRAQMDDIAVNMALVRRYPTVYLGASYDINAYNFSDLGDDSIRSKNWLAALAIRFPLSYDIWTQVQQRKAQQRQGDLKRMELQDKVRFEILTAHKDALFLAAEAERLNSETGRLKAAYEAALAASGPSMAALRAFCSLAGLERRALDAVYAQLTACARLEWARGADFQR